MRTIALFNQKGGVGKTTTTANLGAALAESRRDVILIDLDPQANLTTHFGIENKEIAVSTYRVLADGVPLEESFLQKKPHLRVAPATTDLAAAEVELVSVINRELLLRKMAAARAFKADYVLIDCPPSLGLLTLNALAYATEVIIPLQPHFLALQGIANLSDTCKLVRKQLNPKLQISGVLLCQYEPQARLTGEVTSDVETFLTASRGKNDPWSNAVIFETSIRRNIKLAEAPSFGQSIFEYAPNSAGAADYSVLAEEIMRMEKPAA